MARRQQGVWTSGRNGNYKKSRCISASCTCTKYLPDPRHPLMLRFALLHLLDPQQLKEDDTSYEVR